MANYFLTLWRIISDPTVLTGGWLVCIVFLYYMHAVHQRQLNDRQNEINRLAKENGEYRKFFMPLVRDFTQTTLGKTTRKKK